MGSSSVAANRRFYDSLWSASYVVPPQRFNTWPLLSGFAAAAPARLEIGPGLPPRLPIAGTHLVDVSRPALARLKLPRRSHDPRLGGHRLDAAWREGARHAESDSRRATVAGANRRSVAIWTRARGYSRPIKSKTAP